MHSGRSWTNRNLELPCEKGWDVFWESNPTNIKFPFFRGNTAITLNCQKTLRDPILPGDFTYLDTDYTVGSTTDSPNFILIKTLPIF